jgi:hypothetical protein
LAGLEFARAYLDDLLIISKEQGFDKHLEMLERVLNRLSEAGLKINAVGKKLLWKLWKNQLRISRIQY